MGNIIQREKVWEKVCLRYFPVFIRGIKSLKLALDLFDKYRKDYQNIDSGFLMLQTNAFA